VNTGVREGTGGGGVGWGKNRGGGCCEEGYSGIIILSAVQRSLSAIRTKAKNTNNSKQKKNKEKTKPK